MYWKAPILGAFFLFEPLCGKQLAEPRDLGAIGQKVCLYLGVDAGHHPFFAEKVNRRRLFRLDKKCVWLLTFTQVVWGYSR